MFSEGGNYGHEEAIVIIDALNDLTREILEQQTATISSLKGKNYGSLNETKTSLSKSIKSYDRVLYDRITPINNSVRSNVYIISICTNTGWRSNWIRKY